MALDLFWAFLVGGALCAVGQVLIDYTKLTPARILTAYVVAGVALSAVGLYPWLVELAGGGASVPLTGFGNLLAEGVRESVDEKGFLGIFMGGLTASSAGITAAMVFGVVCAAVFRPKQKEAPSGLKNVQNRDEMRSTRILYCAFCCFSKKCLTFIRKCSILS